MLDFKPKSGNIKRNLVARRREGVGLHHENHNPFIIGRNSIYQRGNTNGELAENSQNNSADENNSSNHSDILDGDDIKPEFGGDNITNAINKNKSHYNNNSNIVTKQNTLYNITMEEEEKFNQISEDMNTYDQEIKNNYILSMRNTYFVSENDNEILRNYYELKYRNTLIELNNIRFLYYSSYTL